jgi:thiamine pyrophosphate-dependent enzyme
MGWLSIAWSCLERLLEHFQAKWMSVRSSQHLMRRSRKYSPQPIVAPASEVLDRLAALLNGKARVTMLCGSGCQGAHEQLLALAERLKAPIVHALKGKEHVEWENPYDVGMTGLIGFSSGYYAMLDCDVLLMLRFPIPAILSPRCGGADRTSRSTGRNHRAPSAGRYWRGGRSACHARGAPAAPRGET